MPRPLPIDPKPDARPAALWRGTVVHVPDSVSPEGSAGLEFFSDGGLVVDDAGRIVEAGPFEAVRTRHARLRVEDRKGCWLIPGFIDCHTHFPQTFIVGSGGCDLLAWLDQFVFPEELRMRDAVYAARVATVFCDQLLRCGTTTALVFGSHDARATSFCFGEARRKGLRMILGKVLHGRDVPAAMIDRPAEALDQCRALVADWHGRHKLRFAVTPRFALTSTIETFDVCRKLLAAHPDLYVHTHVSENPREIELTRGRFPEAAHSCGLYDKEGLLGPRTVLAHGVYISSDERALLRERGASLAHCPSSNFFLGSGIMALNDALAAGLRVGLGTDVGAGTGFSIQGECDHAYKASAMRGHPLSAAQLLHLSTLGGAQALGLEKEVGNFAPGKAADAVVLDPARDAYLQERLSREAAPEAALFVLLVLGKPHIIREVLIDGRVAFTRT